VTGLADHEEPTPMSQADDLVAMDEEEFLGEACIGIDHRAEEEEIIEEFARRLQGETLEPFWVDDDLWFRYETSEYLLPLTISPVDRYVAIGSLASVLADRYELRLHTPSLKDDTHLMLLQPREVWADLDANHADWVRGRFEPLVLGKDYFGGDEVPYVKKD
jgi:hypothetical protein